MDKFDIHETLRIYLPGVFAMILIKYFFSLTWDLTAIATIGVFLGLFIDTFHLAEPAHWYHVWHGNKFPKRYRIDFFGERKVIFYYRFKQTKSSYRLLEYLKNCDKDPKSPTYNPLSRALQAFDSTRYNESEVQQMRLLSSYGRLNFTLAILCFLGTIVSLWNNISPIFNPQFQSLFSDMNLRCKEWLDSIILFLVGTILIDSSFRLWKKSLLFEIKHHKTYSEEALSRLGKLIIMELDTETEEQMKRRVKNY